MEISVAQKISTHLKTKDLWDQYVHTKQNGEKNCGNS